MKRNYKIVAAGATAATTMIGTGAGVAIAASAASTHTLKFTTVTLKQKELSASEFGGADKDVNSKGKIVGFDTIYGKFNSKAGQGRGVVTFVTTGGVLYATATFNNGPTVTGQVTGGTGKFKGASGTLKGTNLNKSGSKTAVTIKYHT